MWKGGFSRQILKRTSPRKLHLIDPWRYQPQFPKRKYGGKEAKKQRDMDKIFERVRARFQEIPTVSIHRGFSDEALGEFQDGYFDWIYLDGNHAYDYVLRDLEIGFSKVRSGGFICGDDYAWGRKIGFPVEKAVQEFINEKGLEERIDIIESQFIIEKP